MTMKIVYFAMKVEHYLSIYQLKETIQDCPIGEGILVAITPEMKVIIKIVYQLSLLYKMCKGNNV